MRRVALLLLCAIGCAGASEAPPAKVDGPVTELGADQPDAIDDQTTQRQDGTPDQGLASDSRTPTADSSAVVRCNFDEKLHSGRCYSAPGYKWMTYSDAKTLCTQRGAEIATIRDLAEDNVAYQVLPALTRAAFIGLVRTGSGFVWESGANVGYQNWGPGEPNNENGSESCVVIWGPNLSIENLRSKWNDVPCNEPGRDTVVCVRTP